jgi:hypothetical protein
MRRRRSTEKGPEPCRIFNNAIVEIWSGAGTCFSIGSVVLDDTGSMYVVRSPASSDHEYRPAARSEAFSSTAFNGGTLLGEGPDWGGRVTLTRLDPLLSAGSLAIHSEDLLHRSRSSRNHPNPFTSTTTVQFGLPRASSIGLAIYEDTALMVGMLSEVPATRC